MIKLVIDSGNSFVKLSVLDKSGQTVELFRVEKLTVAFLSELFEKYAISLAISSAVRDIDRDVEGFLAENCVYYLKFSTTTPIPIENHYQTPQTLGVDRLAAAVGAADMAKDGNLLIFDFGTAITIDFIEDCKAFKGGNIAPGASLRFKALNDYTEKLPFCTINENNIEVCGGNTISAIEGGVVGGIIYETVGYIDYYKAKYENLKIFFTGGDAKYFGYKLKMPIFVVEDIVTRGLYSILMYNYKELLKTSF